MFRSLENDSDGFVNEGLDVSEGSDDYKSSGPSSYNNNDKNTETKIQITRAKYNQESLFREMVYRKEPSKSCEYCYFPSSLLKVINEDGIVFFLFTQMLIYLT